MANLRADNLCGTGGREAINGSVFFDGTGDKLSVPNSADVRLGSNDFTIEAWVKFGNVSGYWDAIMGMWDASNTRRTFAFQRYKDVGGADDAKLYLYVSTDGGSTNWANANGGNLTANVWHHVAGVRDGNTLRIYQNGVEVGNASYSGTIYNNTTDALFIGDVKSGDSNNMNGFISNVRLVNGTCLYPSGTTFTPPTQKLTVVANTQVLACQDSDDPTQEATGKTITAAGNLADTAYVRQQPKVIPPVGVDAGVTFEGDTKVNTQGHMYFPTGTTEERGRGRGVYMLGYSGTPSAGNNDRIDYINIQSQGNSIRFGSLTANRYSLGAGANSTRGLFTGGYVEGNSPDTDVNIIEYITIATEGNSIDFGDRTQVGRIPAVASNDTRCVMANAKTGAGNQDTIDFVTFSTIGNATGFGDLTSARTAMCMSCNSTTRGIFSGGYQPSPVSAAINTIEFITFATTGNGSDFGDLTSAARDSAQGTASNSTRGLIGLGFVSPARVNTIDFITMATTGNAADFGDLTLVRNNYGSLSNSTRGVFLGGNDPYTNTIDFVLIATTGNASDFGDVSVTQSGLGAAGSDSHGGLS